MTDICKLADIEDGDSLGVSIEINGTQKGLIVVRQGEQAFVYINSCPHIGAPLDLQPGKFLTHDKKHILCSTHGALFDINSGLCTFGPCKDDTLEVLPSQVVDGMVVTAA